MLNCRVYYLNNLNLLKIILPLQTMFKSPVYRYIIFCVCLVFSSVLYAQKTTFTQKEIVFKMVKSITELERLKYSLKIIERGKKGFNYYESSVKLNQFHKI